GNNQDGIRPDSIKVQLYADGEKSGEEVTLNEANNWTTTWADLAEKKNGQSIVYTVKEVGSIEGYNKTVNAENSGNIIITNTHIPKME
ncbi:Cna B-type domain-containing protein, partial [Enterococcus plantarum]|uniref:Cna B-type domain-containing protein n=1 Tax=Enterococcus plantarum TaxID=1077675 RepID=UPI001A8E9CEC